MMKTTMISKISLPDGQSGVGCVVTGRNAGAVRLEEDSPRSVPAGPCSADEMGYGLTTLWLAGMVFFLGVAALWNGLGFEGYAMLVFAVLGLLRAAKHVAAAQALAKAEDAAREAQWKRWAEEVTSEKCRVRSGEKEEGGGL